MKAVWGYQKGDCANLRNYQHQLGNDLSSIFENVEVQEEWASMREEYELEIYSPRLDIAVGPFATNERLGDIYDELLINPKIEQLIRSLIEFNKRNILSIDGFVRPPEFEDIMHMNHNARCFLAIEIENNVTRKHLMGGAINASALGRFGVVIPWSDEKLRAFVKLVRYLNYLRNAEKNTFNTSNLIIVTRDQMNIAINETKR